ncbi:hypothetical protein QZH41_014878 [Actinostola sp. cb2023]|nr:hypothetical protein QZH41_014878 [Actinostola sp. cb2023]
MYQYNGSFAVDSLRPSQKNNKWFTDAVSRIKQHVSRTPNHQPAKNAIFFVGDGCDITTNTAARILKGQLDGKTGEEGFLSYETFPYTGLSKTYNTDKQVPDSAGTANALFCGVKTRYGVIGVSEDVVFNKCDTLTEARRVDSLLKLAEDAGMSTGIVTNMRITHATPANLYANCPNRYWENDQEKLSRANDAGGCRDIARQLVDFQGKHGDGIEVVFGGGRRAFLPNTTADPEYPNKNGSRLDGRHLINEWVAKRPDSKFVWKKSQLDAVDTEKTKHLLGLFEYSTMKYEVDRVNDTGGEPSVPEMVEVAIKILKKNPKGFFLMVEEGLIDYGHHDNNAYRALTETVNMDKAVTKATELTDEKDTLIVVTADHGHTMTIAGYPKRGNPILGLVFNSENELALNDKMPFTTLGYQNGPNAVFGPRRNLTGVNTEDKDFLQQSLYNGIDNYESHGGQDVGIYSRGPWADLLTGVVEENFIFHVVDHALCLSDSKQSQCTKPVARAMLGVTQDVEFNKCSSVTEARKVDSLLKLAEDAGMSTGIVTNMRITHATPASLYASCPNRDWESDQDKMKKASDATQCPDIALQLVDFQGKHGDGIEVVFGGGRRAFLPNTIADPEYPNKNGTRLDGRHLINEWVAKRPDSKFVWNKTELENVDMDKTKHLLGLFEYSNMKYEAKRVNDTGGEPSISEMVEVAIKILKKNPKGFFLAVEGGLIDYGHHDNSAFTALTEAISLEKAVSKAKEMTDEKDTLIVVTADHGHTMTISGYPKRGNPIFGVSVDKNNKVELAANDKMPYTTLGYQNGPSAVFGPRKNLTGVNTQDKDFLQQSLYNGADEYESHGGQDVGIYSRGPWADLLTGVVEQNFIFHVVDHALCLSDSKQSQCTKPVARGGKPVGSDGTKNWSSVGMILVFVLLTLNIP